MAKIYDFILLDLKMPRLNGTDTLKIIKKLNPSVPAITFSGNAGNTEMAESVSCGAIECLAKPFEVDTHGLTPVALAAEDFFVLPEGFSHPQTPAQGAPSPTG